MKFLCALRVHEDQQAELLAGGPKGMILRICELFALDGTAHAYAAKPERLDRMPDLLDREIGVLQGGGGKGHEAIGCGRAHLGQGFVLDPDQFGRRVQLGVVPVGIDAERRDVDTLFVHCCDARGRIGHQQSVVLAPSVENGQGVRHRAMCVHIHRLDPCAIDHHFAAATMAMRRGTGGMSAIR